MTKEPLNIDDLKYEFRTKFAKQDSKSKYDMIECEAYKIEQWLSASLRQAMEAVKPEMISGPVNEDMTYGYACCQDDYETNIINFFKE